MLCSTDLSTLRTNFWIIMQPSGKHDKNVAVLCQSNSNLYLLNKSEVPFQNKDLSYK